MAPNASPVRDFEVSLAFVQDLARNAGRMIVSGLADPTKEVKFKLGPGDLVTETDEAVEAKLKQIINLKFPEHLFLCEESSPADESLTDAPTWIIDPVCCRHAAPLSHQRRHDPLTPLLDHLLLTPTPTPLGGSLQLRIDLSSLHPYPFL
eukprot:GHVT01048581.1.p2 GENE.GHVT01048581.1~~GHVT01048581.1.p2  ORF type:complete len:150 (-),score=35.08 GHVT01048581.1:3018-3467(-)